MPAAGKLLSRRINYLVGSLQIPRLQKNGAGGGIWRLRFTPVAAHRPRIVTLASSRHAVSITLSVPFKSFKLYYALHNGAGGGI